MDLFGFLKSSNQGSSILDDSYNSYNSSAITMFKNGQLTRSSKASGAIGHSDIYGSSNQVPVERMLASYSTNVVDYACVYAISNTLAALPTKFTSLTDGTVIEDNELANLMVNRPSPMQSWYDFIEMSTTLLELTGFVVIENVFPEEPKEIVPLRSDKVEVIVDRNGVSKFLYRVNGQTIPFDATTGEAFLIKYANPMDLNRGFSAFNPMRIQQSIDQHSLKFINSFFANGGHIDGFFNYPIMITSSKRKELYAEYEEKFSGSSKAFGMMLLDKDVTYIPNQIKPEEADLSVIRDMQRADVITARGCYPIVLGFLDGASYANANIQWKLYYRNTIKPKAQKIQDALNLNVFHKFGVHFKFDFESVTELKEDEKVLAETIGSYMKSGAVTVNEIRLKFDLGDPLEGGDVLPKVKQDVVELKTEKKKSIYDF